MKCLRVPYGPPIVRSSLVGALSSVVGVSELLAEGSAGGGEESLPELFDVVVVPDESLGGGEVGSLPDVSDEDDVGGGGAVIPLLSEVLSDDDDDVVPPLLPLEVESDEVVPPLDVVPVVTGSLAGSSGGTPGSCGPVQVSGGGGGWSDGAPPGSPVGSTGSGPIGSSSTVPVNLHSRSGKVVPAVVAVKRTVYLPSSR